MIKFADYCFGTLSASINTSVTSISVTLDGSSEPLPTLGVGDYFYATLVDAASFGTGAVPVKKEVIKVTAVSGSNWTVERGSSPQSFSAGDSASLRLSTAALDVLADPPAPPPPPPPPPPAPSYDQSLNTTDDVEFNSVMTPDLAALNAEIAQASVSNIDSNDSLSVVVSSTNDDPFLIMYGDKTSDLRDDYVSGVKIDNTGNIYLASGDGNDGLFVHVTKFDKAGDLVWDIALDDPASSYKSSDALEIDTSGNAFIALSDDSNGAFYLVKLASANGAILWQNKFTFIGGYTYAYQMHYKNNFLYVTAYGDSKQTIYKINATTGAGIWSYALDTTSDISITSDSTDGVYISFTQANTLNVINLTSAGALGWSSNFEFATFGVNASLSSITVTSTDEVIVGYSFYQNSASLSGIGLLKLSNLDGSVILDKKYNSNLYSAINDIVCVGTHIYVNLSGDVIQPADSFGQIKFDSLGASKFDINFNHVYTRSFYRNSASIESYYYNTRNSFAAGYGKIVFAGGFYSDLSNAEILIGCFDDSGLGINNQHGVAFYPDAPWNTELSYVLNAGAITVTTTTDSSSISTSTCTIGTNASEFDLYAFGNTSSSWTFHYNGALQNSNSYSMAPDVGSYDQVMTTDGAGNAFWKSLPAPKFFSSLDYGLGLKGLFSIDSVKIQNRATLSGWNNLAIGNQSLYNLTSGGYNISLGGNTLYNTDIGNYNVAIGESASYYHTNSSYNVAIGSQAMFGSLNYNTNNENVAIGRNTLQSLSNGSRNIAIGPYAHYYGTLASDNICIGYQAGLRTGGSTNVYIGTNVLALAAATSTGNSNIGIGPGAVGYITSGSSNVVVGQGAGRNITTGNYNIMIGYQAGIGVETGSNNIHICNTSTTVSSSMANTIVLGDGTHTSAKVAVAWTITSDRRFKTDIEDLEDGLSFVNALRPRKYKLTHPETGLPSTGVRYGFIAQEVLAVDSRSDLIDVSDPEKLALNETMLISVLVKSVQELSQEVKALKEELNELKKA